MHLRKTLDVYEFEVVYLKLVYSVYFTSPAKIQGRTWGFPGGGGALSNCHSILCALSDKGVASRLETTAGEQGI